jgi:activator of HSP90 ATPase
MKVKTIKQRVVIPNASPEEIYNVYMDSRKHAELTGASASIDPTVGGSFMAWEGYITGKILELEKGNRVVQEWATTEWPEGYAPSRLELDFRAAKEGTEITLVQTGVPEEDAVAYGEGWFEFYWDPMIAYFKR